MDTVAANDGADLLTENGESGKSNLISFEVDGETYGVDITSVREIRAWSGATVLPNTAEFVRGVMNLRGAVIPIIDLRARFGRGQTETTATHVVVVVDIDGKWVGLLVDAVSDIVDIADSQIQPAADFAVTQDESGVLLGVAAVEERMIALINTEALLDGALEDAE